jgi:hypothetical protein
MQICTFSVHVSTKSWFLFYTAERSADCVGKINPGETKTCTPSPSRTAHLTVITRVDNTGCMDQCAKASNFEITVAGGFTLRHRALFKDQNKVLMLHWFLQSLKIIT